MKYNTFSRVGFSIGLGARVRAADGLNERSGGGRGGGRIFALQESPALFPPPEPRHKTREDIHQTSPPPPAPSRRGSGGGGRGEGKHNKNRL